MDKLIQTLATLDFVDGSIARRLDKMSLGLNIRQTQPRESLSDVLRTDLSVIAAIIFIPSYFPAVKIVYNKNRIHFPTIPLLFITKHPWINTLSGADWQLFWPGQKEVLLESEVNGLRIISALYDAL